ncbi:Flp pilus assembly protein CpaB [Devosia insulae DS-56]|uniref:Flp pilus assembly protein CpaB n=1 Tax=Devosia insulae DS-56 TaxID=1116389 RepID=A0A1E5XMM5_9HYPH|nr:Flp pilus assembly protein CpaB [Devosia insulae DS-56]
MPALPGDWPLSEELVLRRTQTVALKDDGEIQEALRPELPRTAAQKADPAVLDKVLAEVTWTPPPTQAERRNLDAWRSEALQTVVTNTDRRKGGDRRKPMAPPPSTGWRWKIPPSRIALLVVALVAGGLAAYLTTQTNQPVAQPVAEPVTEVVQEARVRVLAARTSIGLGQRLSAETVEWVDWPEGAVRPEYITTAAAPDAITQMSGAMARFEFFPGEPIRADKLALEGDGYLSAVLDSGTRGVSVMVAAASASGGFVVPNDRVDVVLTRSKGGESDGQVSDTILRNVRVLAINTRLGETGTTGAAADPEDPRAEIFANEAIATLQLDPGQSEVIINAATSGRLTLVLRPFVDSSEVATAQDRSTNQAIRASSPFWTK